MNGRTGRRPLSKFGYDPVMPSPPDDTHAILGSGRQLSMGQDRGRLGWVDAARGIGIVLVVFGHVWRGLWNAGILGDETLYGQIDAGIYLFHMPLFFLVSGLFFEKSVRRDGAIGSILKRCETLLYPLLLWSWITACFLLLAGSLASRVPITLTEAILYPFPPKDIFWFLWALFVIQAVCALLVRSSTSAFIALYLLSFAVAALVPMLAGADLLHGAAANLPIFLTGVLLTRLDLFRVKPSAPIGIAGALAFAASLYAAVVFGLQPGVLGTACSLIATLGFCAAIYGFAPTVPRRPMAWVSHLGTISMAIYVMHVIPGAATRIVMVRLGVESVGLHLLAGTALGVFLPVLAYLILKRLGLLRLFGLGRDAGKQVPALSAGQG